MSNQAIESFNFSELENQMLKRIYESIPLNTKVERNSKTGYIIAKSPELQQEKYSISKYLNFGKYNQVIYDFYLRLEEYFAHCDLSAFYMNMKSLRIKNKNMGLSDILSKLITGDYKQSSYNAELNRIKITEKQDIDVQYAVGYELLHMASTIKTPEVLYSGFSQEHPKSHFNIGESLNQGYTEYLNRKYFNEDNDNKVSDEQVIAQGIEQIIGARRMEQLYFSADLNGLLTELSKYTTRENAINLIKRLDSIHDKVDRQDHKESEFKQLRQDVASIYLEQQHQLLDSGKISEEEYQDRKLMYADIYVNESIVFSRGAQLVRENGQIKVIDTNNGVTRLDTNRYKSTSLTTTNHKL